jgi:hypothetical protein
MSSKAYCHDEDTKETLRIPQTPDLEEEGWLTEVRTFCHLKGAFNLRFWERALPHITLRSVGAYL